MVYFTCDVCGESVKKKQIEKHCQTKCRNAWNFTCMDCNKVFSGYDYEKHTSCVSETERYAGKFLSAKAEQKKTEQKALYKDEETKETSSPAEAKNFKYLINGNEWMGWKRTIRHVLQDQTSKSMKIEDLWKIIRETYMGSKNYKEGEKTKIRGIFNDKTKRPRFEIENGIIKLKPRKE